jgi:protein-tyrosine-phosphatase
MSSPNDADRIEHAPLLLFVCSGNICRSPMAAALAAGSAARAGLEVRVASAGTMALVGEMAEPDAQCAVEELGLSLTSHRAQQATSNGIRQAALTVAATRHHRSWLVARAPDAAIASFDEITGLGDIPDPYGAGLHEYRAVRDMLLAGMPSVLAALKASLDEKAKHRRSV